METAVKERPILFNGEMVRAVLDGRKTQTRRVIKPQPTNRPEPCCYSGTGWAESNDDGGCKCSNKPIRCPYGEPGDRLWVRETWMEYDVNDFDGENCDEHHVSVLYRSSYDPQGPGPAHVQPNAVVPHQVDYETLDNARRAIHQYEVFGEKWKPSIFMPRWASRINLELTDVRVERVQDISEEDARAEGLERIHVEYPPSPSNDFQGDWSVGFKDYKNIGEYAGWGGDAGAFSCPLKSFMSLWNSINESRGFGWEVNPWVWVVEFKVIDEE